MPILQQNKPHIRATSDTPAYGSIIRTLMAFILLSGLIGTISLYFAAGNLRWTVFCSYFLHPALLVLNILPVLIVLGLCYAAVNRIWIAGLITGTLILGFSLANYFLLLFRNDTIHFSDLLLLSEAAAMGERYRPTLNISILVALAFFIVSLLLIGKFASYRMNGKNRILMAAACLLLAFATFFIYSSDRVYNRLTNERFINKWNDTQVYQSKGFLYPFLHSVKDAFSPPPPGYNEDETASLLSTYQNADIPADQKVNVIGIMLEAFADFSIYDQIDFKEDVYADYHALEAESYTGTLLSNVFGGGTINTERCFLTGFSDLTEFRTPTRSYVRYFRDQGYTVEGSHPYLNWFYNRTNVNRNLGFENYYFRENRYASLSPDVEMTPDSILFPEILKLYDANKSTGKPYFSFNVSVQNHGPYAADQPIYEELLADAPGITDADRIIMNNYFAGIKDTQKQLVSMIEQLRTQKEPVVLVLFGDHKPWMGDNSITYNDLNIALDSTTYENFSNHYATRYLIWANDAAKKALGQDFSGEGPTVGPYFLMSLLFDQCGWSGSDYMQYSRTVRDTVPLLHSTDLYLEGDALTSSPSDPLVATIEEFKRVQYFYAHKNIP